VGVLAIRTSDYTPIWRALELLEFSSYWMSVGSGGEGEGVRFVYHTKAISAQISFSSRAGPGRGRRI